ncbi:MAG: hypothetical protein ACREPD_05035 [Stenotrophomonas sp.]|uniref:hypothetical protein n=1 Tax=Stenotrophomonas sp. TaxID=69392 RepID=UPI003D6CBCBF
MPYTRATQYQNLGDLMASTLNDDQDSPVMMIQQLAAGAMQEVPDPETGLFVWDAKGNRIIRVGDAIADADALNLRGALRLIEEVQNGGGSIGINPKFWQFVGDGEVTDFPLAGADVDDPLFYDTAAELTAGAGNYKVSRPVDADGVGEFLIVPGVSGAPPAIRFQTPLADGVRGFTTLRGYARPWIGPSPIYTVAPRIVSITSNTTLAGDMHNTLILANSATPITLTIRANTGSAVDWKEGQFFSVQQVGAGQVTLAIEGGGLMTVPVNFQSKTRDVGSVISATCTAPDADAWTAAGDLLRGASSPDLQAFTLADSSVLIGTNITTGTTKASMVLPFGIVLSPVAQRGIYASVSEAQPSGTPLTVDVKRNGTSILNIKLTFDNGERSTITAALPPTLVAGGDILAAGDEITVDVQQVGTAGAKGLKVYLVGQRSS